MLNCAEKGWAGGARRPPTWSEAGRGEVAQGAGGIESGAGRVTHEIQDLQVREAAEGPSRDARELVVGLLRDGEDERSEAAVDVACGGAERDEE